MILPAEYSWLESYLDNDSLWLEDSVSWEDAFDLVLSDLTVYGFFASSFFANSHFFVDSFVKLSFLDVLLISESGNATDPRELYDLFVWDVFSTLYFKFAPAQFLFYTDYQDFMTMVLYYSPELMTPIADYVSNCWLSNTFHCSPAAFFDTFNDSIMTVVAEFIEHLLMLFAFVWFVVIFINVLHMARWDNPIEAYAVRLFGYLFSSSRDFRLQFESFLQVFFFFFFYWSMMVSTFDDDQEELIETFDTGFFYFFCALITFLLFRYSIHYFAFLEASVSEGRTVSFVAKQFFRDFVNTFALFLRFFILLFRLNVYDTLDDFYDSYYIFVGDFDDDEYYSELFFSAYSLLFFDYDVNDDRAFTLEDESDFFFDLFYIYFLCWGKFFLFIFFILEEILRLSLGFYICYLITFEVHSVNCSYVEDTYIQATRQSKIRCTGTRAENAFFKFK